MPTIKFMHFRMIPPPSLGVGGRKVMPTTRFMHFRTALCLFLLLGVCVGTQAVPVGQASQHLVDAADWADADVGAPANGEQGRTAVANGHVELRGVGADLIHNPAAQLHFHYVPAQGDFELVARVTDKDELDRLESRVGIMVRPNLNAGTPYVFVYFSKQQLCGLGCNQQKQSVFSFGYAQNQKLPIWLKLIRWHRILTAYYSADGRNWTAMQRGYPIDLPDSVLVGVAVSNGAATGATTANFDQIYVGPPRLAYRTSWIGNTFGGGGKWVQDHIAAMYVAPDGTCYTQAEWDEGQGDSSMYRDGDKVGMLENSGPGQGGTAITGDGKFIYLGTVKLGTKLPAVRRFHLDGPHAAYSAGPGDTSYIMMPPHITITALACGAGRLYVADGPGGHIYVYDLVSGASLRDWVCEGPRTLTVDTRDNVWVNQRVQGHAVVRCYTSDGTDTGRKIEGVVDPGGLAIDNRGRLLLAENGPDQQVRIYDELDAAPKLIDTFGAKGGVYSGVPGIVAPNKLPANIVGLGTDRDGNLYIGSDGWAWSGVDIRQYTPAGTMKWRVIGLEGVIDFGDIDPDTGTDFYTEQEHFTLDLRKSQGQEASYKGFTLDPFAFPDDPRLHIDGQSTMVRYLKDHDGKPRRFLFVTNNWGSYVLVYRFDPAHHGEISIPCMMLSVREARTNQLIAWPPFQPKTGAWIWRDSQGDGRIREQDIASVGMEGLGWDIDFNGDIWQAGQHIYYYKYLGLDDHGVPRYAPPEQFPVPAPFTELLRIRAFPLTHTLYLSGFTKEHPNKPYNGFTFVGTEVARYDHWGKPNSALTWRITVPRPDAQSVTESLDIAGDYVFALENFSPRLHVYEARTGKEVTVLVPGPEVGGQCGWVDMPYALHAFRRDNGEYLIFTEEDYLNKVIMYRWVPPGSATQSAKSKL
jgi:hypothetical protein